MEYGNQVWPTPFDLATHPFQPRDWVNLKTWKTSSPQDQLSPKRMNPTWWPQPPVLPWNCRGHSVGATRLSEKTLEPQPPERQPGAAPVSQSSLKLFKIHPKPVYPSFCLFISSEATIKGLCHISPLSLCLLTHSGAILCGHPESGGLLALGNCEWKTIFIEFCCFLSK